MEDGLELLMKKTWELSEGAVKTGANKASVCRNFGVNLSTLYDTLYREKSFSA